MIRSTPTALLPQRWQSRADILKAYLDSLSPDELRRVRPAYYWLRFGQEAWKRACARKANFNPDQPRDYSGRWTNSGGARRTSGTTGEGLYDRPLESFAAARRRGRSVAYCMTQYAVDGLMCNSVEPASRRAACWKQATERLGNCLAGREIPPLIF